MNLCLHFVAGCRNKIPRQKHFKGGGFIRLPTPGYCPSLQVGRDNSNLTTLRSQSRAESNVCTRVPMLSCPLHFHNNSESPAQRMVPRPWSGYSYIICHNHDSPKTCPQAHLSGHPLFQGSLDDVSFTIKANQHSYACLASYEGAGD